MPSLIHGYNYDIFISYRQKDNKYDGWVTGFVDNLKKELEATFKEEVSVYFDINPSDYLLESYDVDASLKDKLKCLVFIPILSRTYCDSKSFAWVHEFKAFVEQASKDQYGLKIKLPNGNVASRVLPVRIHDLDEADIKECESVLGGVLRGIEFIYKEAGIDKPLAPDDDDKRNLNNTKYRIQIIKVAHAIKEIILGMKAEPAMVVEEKVQAKESFREVNTGEIKEAKEKPAKTGGVRLLIPVIVVALFIIAGIIAYPKIFKKDTLERLRASGERISVAVMPFQNMTSDTTWNIWQDGIQEMLTNSLSNSEELKVRQTEFIKGLIQSKSPVNNASVTISLASSISQKLDADIFIYGQILKSGSTLRLYTRLIKSKTKEILKSFQIEGPAREEMIFGIIDTLSRMVNNFFLISNYEEENFGLQEFVSTNSAEAFRYYILGMNAFYKADNSSAVNWLNRSYAIDSNFTLVMWGLSAVNENLGRIEEGKNWALKYCQRSETLPLKERLMASFQYAQFTQPGEAIKYLNQLQELDDQIPGVYFCIGYNYSRLNQFDKAIPAYETALEIYNKWGLKPQSLGYYIFPGYVYHLTGQYIKEKQLYRKAEKDFPDDHELINNQIVLSLTEGDTVSANQYIKKYISLRKDKFSSEAQITGSLASIYSRAGIPDKAEKYYRQALNLESKNPGMMNNLAYFLIDRDRDINEGMDLINKALEIKPDNYNLLHTKGWGLYKQGIYEEALDFLQKSWDLRMKNGTYNHDAFLHLEAAKKAVTGMKHSEGP